MFVSMHGPSTRPIGLVFKQLPRDPASVNAWKTCAIPKVDYRFSENVMTSIITLRKIRKNLVVFTPKNTILKYFNVK